MVAVVCSTYDLSSDSVSKYASVVWGAIVASGAAVVAGAESRRGAAVVTAGSS